MTSTSKSSGFSTAGRRQASHRTSVLARIFRQDSRLESLATVFNITHGLSEGNCGLIVNAMK